MNKIVRIYIVFVTSVLSFYGNAQDLAYNDPYNKAYGFAFEGKHKSSREILKEILSKSPNNKAARLLLARTNSWDGHYTDAREDFNIITSSDKQNIDAWISAIKNELYAKNDATALGLANKALYYLESNKEIERLKAQALENIKNIEYPKYVDTPDIDVQRNGVSKKKEKTENQKEELVKRKESEQKEVLNNRFSINNSFTVFNDVYDPMIFSSISYRRQTLAGSIIPRINYSNRLNQHGIQYDIDFYPKFSKRFYAYLNYGYSNASIYPNHKMGGDLYANLPGAMEFSAGMRHIIFDTRSVTVYANSIGHYRGNYYFSLRSYLTPKENDLMTVSGNLLVRKYLRDAENFMGFNVGIGFSPELRQIRDGTTLLAETLLYVESQRLRIEYQFSRKKAPENIYRTNLGVTRQEFVSNSGKFFWAVSAGIAYQVKF